MANTRKAAQDSTKLSGIEAKLLPLLDQINRYAINAYTGIEEHDTNSESENSLLWSKEKTTREIAGLMKQVLSDRKALHDAFNLDKLAYESRVRRWSFSVDEGKNGYRIAVEILGQLAGNFEGLVPMYESELEEALTLKYFPEALEIFNDVLDGKKSGWDEKIAYIESFLSRFGASPERLYMSVNLFKSRANRDLNSFANQLNMPEAEWQKYDDLYETELRVLSPQFAGHPYEKELRELAEDIIFDRAVVMHDTKIVGYKTGRIDVNVSGIIRSDWELRRIEKRSGRAGSEDYDGKTGVLIKGFSGTPKRRIDETVTDTLPYPAEYTYYFYNRTTGAVGSRYTINHNQIQATITQATNNVRLSVMGQSSAEPIAGAKVAVYKTRAPRLNSIDSLVTGKDGTVNIDLSKYKDVGGMGSEYLITVKDPRFALGSEEFYAYWSEEKMQNSERQPYDKVNFYLDRPIYRRGQKIMVGVVLSRTEKDNKVTLRSDQEGTMILEAFRNDKREEIDRRTYKTNENGVAEMTFDIPEDQLLNGYTLKTEDVPYNVEVQDYKLSYLTIRIDSIPTGAVVGRRMKVYGHTTDLNGNPVPAKIEMTVMDNLRTSGESQKDGSFSLEVPLSSSLNLYYWGQRMSVKATDALGNVAEDMRQIWLTDSTNMPLNATSMISGAVLDKHKFSLSTKDQPYLRMPLGDLSRYRITASLISQSTQERTLLGELPTEDIREYSLPNLLSGMYTLEISVVDYYGHTVTSTRKDLYFYASSDKQIVDGPKFMAVHIEEEGVILYGAKESGFLHISTFTDALQLPALRVEQIQGGKLYRMRVPGSHPSSIRFVTTHEGETYSSEIRMGRHSEDPDNSSLRLTGMEIEDGESFLPGAQFTRDIRVTAPDGKPVHGAPVFVTVFDKAVADAAGGEDFWRSILLPKSQFEPMVEPFALSEVVVASASQSRQSALKGALHGLRAVSEENASNEPVGAGGEKSVQTRRNFVETAYFSTLLMTDKNGKVKLDFKLPDTQTKYVTKVYTFTPDAEKDLMKNYDFEVYSPLSIEISLPRYLYWGDQLIGEVRLMNTRDTADEVTYALYSDSEELLRGAILVPAQSTASVPFSLPVTEAMGSELSLTARATSSTAGDVIERKLPILSDRYTYNVATPISIYHQQGATLRIPKADRIEGTALLDLYFSPAHVVLSGLANEHATLRSISEMSLFESVHCLAVYAEIQQFLRENAAIRSDFHSSLRELRSSGAVSALGEGATRSDRQANARALAAFYDFILNPKQLGDFVTGLQNRILEFEHPRGGFIYSKYSTEPSPWLTSYVLQTLRGAARTVALPKMKEAFDKSLDLLLSEMKDMKHQYHYSDYMGYRMLLHHYEKPEKAFLRSFSKELDEQVAVARKGYQTTWNSQLIHFAKYSQLFDDKDVYEKVERFIRDRSRHTFSDRELLLLHLFLSSGPQAAVSDEVIKFMLTHKQGTIWDNPFTLDAVKVLLRQVTPTTFTSNAAVTVGGERYSLGAEERATGRLVIPLRSLTPAMEIAWPGVEAEYVFGGVRYQVSEPISQVTPTGDRLKVHKEIFARRITDGKSHLIRITPSSPATQGEQLVIRYIVEAAQDLSLVTIKDERTAGAEPGYNFEGYGVNRGTWWGYTRRETADYIFVDYLSRGEHIFEIEATATLGGHFASGPAQVQSYYAPEYAGNSGGTYLSIRPNNTEAPFVMKAENSNNRQLNNQLKPDNHMAQVTLGGNPVQIHGNLPQVGIQAPDFVGVKSDLSEVKLSDFRGKRVVLNIFPSIDTGVCAQSVRTFNKMASDTRNTVILCISHDLPFAMSRFCAAEGIQNVETISLYRDPSFGQNYGVLMEDGALKGLLARSIVVIDENGKVIYTQLVSDIAEEPNYNDALAVL